MESNENCWKAINGDQSIEIDSAKGVIVFRNFRVEKLWPTKLAIFKIGFTDIGRNGRDDPLFVGSSDNDYHILETLHGRVWLPKEFTQIEEALDQFKFIWEELQKNLTKEERKAHIGLLRKSHPIAKITGTVLLIILIGVVFYYFQVVLPKI